MKIILIIMIILLTACSPQNKTNDNSENKTTNNVRGNEIKHPIIFESEKALGEAVTDIIDRGENRVSNIVMACNKISGKKLMPDEEFSFNNLTGKKTEKNGYKYAPVIVDGEKSYGIGGGVCQVSSTIYMAAVNSGLQITEHYNHSEPVAYAPDGMDATVVYGYKDFKFRNNTDKLLYIYTWVEQEKVFSKIIQKSIDIQSY